MKRSHGTKRLLAASVAAILILLLIPIFSLTASGYDPDVNKSDARDGVKAELSVSPAADGGLEVTVSINNLCEYAKNFRASLSSDNEGILLTEKSSAGTIANGESGSFVFLLSKKNAETEATTTEATQPTNDGAGCGGCSGFTGIAAGIAALAAAVFLAIVAPGKKRLLCLFLACLTLVPLLGTVTLPADAAARDRTLTLTDKANLEGVGEVKLTAEVTFTYDFSEKKVDGMTGLDQFELTYYFGPHGDLITTDSVIKDIADCGFTSIPLEYNTTEQNKAALTLFKKYGLTCSALQDPRIINLSYSQTPLTQEEVDKVVKEVVEDYKDFDNIKGWWLYDEPGKERFEILSMLNTAFKKFSPDKKTVINLFPNYAKDNQLGTDGYEKYLTTFVETVRPDFLSYDYYHFDQNGGTVRTGYFTNLEQVRTAGKEAGIDQMAIVLLTKHLKYGNVTDAQIAWEANTCLAYGMKHISFFTYALDQSLVDQGWSDACIAPDGSKFEHYYSIQRTSKWLVPLGRELAKKESTAVFHISSVSESGCKRYTSYGDLGKVKGKNFVIGFFDDGSFLMVNRIYSGSAQNTATLLDLFDGLEYFDTESSEWKDASTSAAVAKDENGNYTVSLAPGASVLLRVK